MSTAAPPAPALPPPAPATVSTSPLDGLRTVAELVDKLGGIPLSRIRIHPILGSARDEDVLAARRCELVDGVLVEKAMGYYESRLAAVLIRFLDAFCSLHQLGIVIGEGGMVRVDRSQVRLPDVAFLSWRHFPGRLLPAGAILGRVPDLAVEILSAGNTEAEMDRKRAEYFLGGTLIVWQVYPLERGVRVYSSVNTHRWIGEDGILDGGTAVPGFSLRVSEWFAEAGQRTE